MTLIGNIRLAGINEHFERVQFFMNYAEKCEDPIDKFRYQIAAVYSCRAISELMLEAADKQEVCDPKSPKAKINRTDLERLIEAQIPYYFLIERIRIHDFHRFGLLPPHTKYKTTMILGPLKLKSQKGGVNVQLGDVGLETTTTGNSVAKFQRPLIIQDGKMFDEESKEYVALKDILDKFLFEIPKVIKQFSDMVASGNQKT
ncbi:MAG: hypothetical protein HYU97_12300 [Deltaproteobacteria bacterium]|nr:hypothetical protein [Deltaproteobacteria bacterium]